MKTRLFYPTYAVYFLVILFVAMVSQGFAQQRFPFQNSPNPVTKGIEKEDPHSKIGPDLIGLEEEYKSYNSTKNARVASFEPSNALLQLRSNNMVVIDAVAIEDAVALLNELKAIGMVKAVHYGRVVSGQLPIKNIDKMASLQHLRFARPAYKPMNNAGVVDSQGDKAQGSDIAKTKFNVKGRNNKIGVLSDSYNNLTGAKVATLTGDLPGPGNPYGYTTPIQVLEDLPGGGSDEGRAMMEIIHDVAPGASMAFHTAFNGTADFAKGIIDLKDAGCNVIVDDVYYLGEPFFQDGIIAQAVDDVVQTGVTYFSSAGNHGRNSYESAFNSSGVVLDNFGEVHSFSNDDLFQSITIPTGNTFYLTLQWDDPFYSVSGGSGAKSDLNIYLLNDSLTQIVAGSAYNNIGDDPVEIIGFQNLGTETNFNILITRAAGPAPGLLKYIIFQSSGIINEYATNSSTTFGHMNAAGTIAVAAARYTWTPAFGTNPPEVEPFSSAGGTPILFNKWGNRISKVVRKKPEITAPDGVNTTFFIPGLDFPDEDGFPNFFGTSASAPHAAGAAALMLEAAQNNLAPKQVSKILQNSAIDMEDPLLPGFEKGFDFRTGTGLIQVDKAVKEVLEGMRVASFTLVNAETNADIMAIKEGTEINLGTLPTQKLNILALTNPATVGSVVFSLNGEVRTENILPYAYAGDINGKYRVMEPSLKPGQYTLTATPYAGYGGTGEKGTALTVKFRVVQSDVISFTLVNADNNTDIQTIEDGDVLSLASLPTSNVSIRANTSPEKVGSVWFNLIGTDNFSYYNVYSAVENLLPYVIAGDDNGKYNPMNPPLYPGQYTLTATTHSLTYASGVRGGSLRVRFEVVGAEAIASKTVEKEVSSGVFTTIAYPNPSPNKVTLHFEDRTERKVDISLYNTQGVEVQRVNAFISQGNFTKEVDLSPLPKGLYFVHIKGQEGLETIKIVKQ